MQEKESHSVSLAPNEALQQLNNIHEQLTPLSTQLQKHFRNYISIYISSSTLSEQCFLCLFEHQIIQKLFGPEGDKLGTTVVLQLFNLLLANTHKTDTLVYIFSQHPLHQFLFERVDIDGDSENVEYYAQLLKTVIMKVSRGESSLLKLFCNNRYASFPLLARSTYMALHGADELVRVTARQCVLLLVGLIARRKAGQGYLVQTHMAFFYSGLTSRFLKTKDQEGDIRYMADLVSALHHHSHSLSMLMNCLLLNFILPCIKDLPCILTFLSRWTIAMQEHDELPSAISLEVRRVIYRIMGKVLFDEFLNASYISALMHCQSLATSEKVSASSLDRYYKGRFEKLQPFLRQFDEVVDSGKDNSLILLAWAQFMRNAKPKQWKPTEHKRVGIFNFFLGGKDPLEIELSQALEANGFDSKHNKVPLFKYTFTTNFRTALFVIQRILVTQQQLKEESPYGGHQQYEVFYNEQRGKLNLDENCCRFITKMVEGRYPGGLVEKIEHEAFWECRVQPEEWFLIRMSQYLEAHLVDFIPILKDNYMMIDKSSQNSQLQALSELLRILNIGKRMQKQTSKKVLWKMEQLQVIINKSTFQKDFKVLINYFTSDHKIMHPDVCYRVDQYVFLAGLIAPEVPPLVKFMAQQWQQFMAVSENKQKLKFSGKFGSFDISIYPQPCLLFKIDLICSKTKSFSSKDQLLLQQFIRSKALNKKDETQAEALNGLRRICLQRQEIMTKAFVRYFEQTYNKGCERISSSIKLKLTQPSHS